MKYLCTVLVLWLSNNPNRLNWKETAFLQPVWSKIKIFNLKETRRIFMWIFLMWKESVEKEVKALICKFSLMCFRVKVILKIFIRWTMFDSKLLFFFSFLSDVSWFWHVYGIMTDTWSSSCFIWESADPERLKFDDVQVVFTAILTLYVHSWTILQFRWFKSGLQHLQLM